MKNNGGGKIKVRKWKIGWRRRLVNERATRDRLTVLTNWQARGLASGRGAHHPATSSDAPLGRISRLTDSCTKRFLFLGKKGVTPNKITTTTTKKKKIKWKYISVCKKERENADGCGYVRMRCYVVSTRACQLTHW